MNRRASTVLSSLQDIIVNGWPKQHAENSKQLRPYYRGEVSVEDGVILKCEQMLIAKNMQTDILQPVHAGHASYERHPVYTGVLFATT